MVEEIDVKISAHFIQFTKLILQQTETHAVECCWRGWIFKVTSSNKQPIVKQHVRKVKRSSNRSGWTGTLIVVSRQVSLVYVQVVICVQLPELTVDDIKMFIGEELCQLVNLFLLFQ